MQLLSERRFVLGVVRGAGMLKGEGIPAMGRRTLTLARSDFDGVLLPPVPHGRRRATIVERYRSVGVVAPDSTFGSNSRPMRLLAQQLELPIPELSLEIRRLMGRPFDEKTRAATSS
jgi:hypothetical protein